jgi:hypothetical protein
MKKIQAIIKPFKLDEAKQALADLNVVGMTARSFEDPASRPRLRGLPVREAAGQETGGIT